MTNNNLFVDAGRDSTYTTITRQTNHGVVVKTETLDSNVRFRDLARAVYNSYLKNGANKLFVDANGVGKGLVEELEVLFKNNGYTYTHKEGTVQSNKASNDIVSASTGAFSGAPTTTIDAKTNVDTVQPVEEEESDSEEWLLNFFFLVMEKLNISSEEIAKGKLNKGLEITDGQGNKITLSEGEFKVISDNNITIDTSKHKWDLIADVESEVSKFLNNEWKKLKNNLTINVNLSNEKEFDADSFSKQIASSLKRARGIK